jgi:hypothetical protein
MSTKQILAYGLENSTILFFDVELLWKSFKFSHHAIPGECLRDAGYRVFSDPNGNPTNVVAYTIFDAVEHL